MNVLASIPSNAATLPALLDRAAAALNAAKSSAEVLEARDMARVAYDAAKSAGRLARAKQAHDTVLSEVYRAQADALTIEARAKMRLAEEYDAAQDRGEIRGNGDKSFSGREKLSGPQIIPPKQLHEARAVRDAERADPGITERAIQGMVDRGEEPTKAKLNREIATAKPVQPRVMDPNALWLWGRLKDFERDGIIRSGAAYLISEMTDPMRADVRRLAPLVREFLEELEMAV